MEPISPAALQGSLDSLCCLEHRNLQAWMLAAAAVLGALTIAGTTTPWILLVFTFLLALGTAMNAPAWEAIIPELVPRSDIKAAVALSGIGINVGRAVGPALGGFLVAFAGPGYVFLLNATSFVGVLVVLYRWNRPLHESVLPAERIMGAMRALRSVRMRDGAIQWGLFRDTSFHTGSTPPKVSHFNYAY